MDGALSSGMTGTRIYVAGPLFSKHERSFLEELVVTIADKLHLDQEKNFFLPHRDAGDIGVSGSGRENIFGRDLQELKKCDIVIALLDGPDIDSGTAVELGFAYAKRKKIFGILTDWRRWHGDSVGPINNMIWGICGKGMRIYKDFDDALLEDLKKEMKT
jgi:nucleoside 2-deoxyribosyltransferase